MLTPEAYALAAATFPCTGKLQRREGRKNRAALAQQDTPQSGVVTKYQTYPDQEKEKRTPRPHLDSTLCTIPKVLVLVLPVYTVPNVPVQVSRIMYRTKLTSIN